MKATKVVYLRLLPEDKAKGNYIDIYNCPIAQAFKRVLKPECEVTVGGVMAFIYPDADSGRYTVFLGASGHKGSVYKHPNRVTRIRVEIPKSVLA